MIRYRGGRSNPHTLYEQLGSEPDKDRDRPIGAVFLPSETARVVALLNVGAAREAMANGEIPYANVPLVALDPEDVKFLLELAEDYEVSVTLHERARIKHIRKSAGL